MRSALRLPGPSALLDMGRGRGGAGEGRKEIGRGEERQRQMWGQTEDKEEREMALAQEAVTPWGPAHRASWH